ncbi:uncharacterized protein CLUP02_06347 [Colletotrichum lupini]|uniref:Uncharacterized protein n=1 Tax=Colletotrichum lupini TaxID=145971 RepID=A0A9Q8SNY4_9PEZI|nr:uncharacterized protein CLUP02_06347 [Colletotrichum lupini]UQC80862.1 hypothetical protein CLUP02_06347 [Colletotrichum lupini]
MPVASLASQYLTSGCPKPGKQRSTPCRTSELYGNGRLHLSICKEGARWKYHFSLRHSPPDGVEDTRLSWLLGFRMSMAGFGHASWMWRVSSPRALSLTGQGWWLPPSRQDQVGKTLGCWYGRMMHGHHLINNPSRGAESLGSWFDYSKGHQVRLNMEHVDVERSLPSLTSRGWDCFGQTISCGFSATNMYLDHQVMVNLDGRPGSDGWTGSLHTLTTHLSTGAEDQKDGGQKRRLGCLLLPVRIYLQLGIKGPGVPGEGGAVRIEPGVKSKCQSLGSDRGRVDKVKEITTLRVPGLAGPEICTHVSVRYGYQTVQAYEMEMVRMRRIVESSAGTTVRKRMEAQNMGTSPTPKWNTHHCGPSISPHPSPNPAALSIPSGTKHQVPQVPIQNLEAVRPYRPVLSYGSIRADFVSALFIAMLRLYRAQLSARPTSSHFFTLSRPYLNKFAWHPPTATLACFESNLLIGPNSTTKPRSTIARPSQTQRLPPVFASNHARPQLDDYGLIDDQPALRCYPGSTNEYKHPMAPSTSGCPSRRTVSFTKRPPPSSSRSSSQPSQSFLVIGNLDYAVAFSTKPPALKDFFTRSAPDAQQDASGCEATRKLSPFSPAIHGARPVLSFKDALSVNSTHLAHGLRRAKFWIIPVQFGGFSQDGLVALTIIIHFLPTFVLLPLLTPQTPFFPHPHHPFPQKFLYHVFPLSPAP